MTRAIAPSCSYLSKYPARRALVAVGLWIVLVIGGFAGTARGDETPATGPKSYSQTVALIIANQDYLQTDDIAYATQDANAFALFASEVLGAQVHRFDNLGTNRMRELIGDSQRLGSLANFVLTQDTDLYIYYVGHGTHDSPQDPSLTQNYLLPTDANPDQKFLADQALSLSDLEAALRTLQARRLKTGRITLVLESCFSGLNPSADGQQSGGLVRGVSAPPLGRAAAVELPDIRLWAATSPDTDFAVWDTEFQRGIFTDALMSALHDGKADANGDFQITAAEMRSSVTATIAKRLARLAASGQTSAFQQRPSFTGMNDDEVVIRYDGEVYPSYSLNQERAFIEAFRNDELMAAANTALASSDPQTITETLELLRGFSLTCEFCEEEQQRAALQTQINLLSARASACKVESDLLQSFVRSGALTRMSFLLNRCECCPQKASVQACVDSNDAAGASCQCLLDGTCPTPGSDLATTGDGATNSADGQTSTPDPAQGTTPDTIATPEVDPNQPSPAFLAALDLMPNPSTCRDWDAFLGQWQNHPKAPDDMSPYQAKRHAICEVEQQVMQETFLSELALLRSTGSCQEWEHFQAEWSARRHSGALLLDIDAELRRAELYGEQACEREDRQAAQDCLDAAKASSSNQVSMLRRCALRYEQVPGVSQEAARLIKSLSCSGVTINGICVSKEQAYRRLQLALYNTACYAGSLDGSFNSATRKALGTFSKVTGQDLSASSAKQLANAVLSVERNAGFQICPPEQTQRRCTIARVNTNIASISSYNHSSGRGFLAVRNGCSTRFSQVGELYRGDIVEITGKEGSWYRVSCIEGRCQTPLWGRATPSGCSYGKYLSIIDTNARCD